MKLELQRFICVSLVALAFQSVSRADDNPVAPATPTNSIENLSYSIGMNIGNSLKRSGLNVDAKVIGEAIGDVLSNAKPRFTEQQAQEIITKSQQELQAKRQQEREQLAEKNHAESAKFFDANKQKPDVKVQEVKLPDGSTAELQYKVLAEGTGDSPKPDDTVSFNFRLSNLDGTEIDSSLKHGQPVKTVLKTFRIEGVKAALEKMKPGGKRELFIPASLAFQDNGMGPSVEPGAGIIMEVELLSFEEPQAPQPLTSNIIKVPSKEELDKGAKIEELKPEDVKKLQMQQQQSNAPVAKP